ncbi:MAG: tetraacyldisaccharide 4'-kinase [Pseudomonadota bacterium]
MSLDARLNACWYGGGRFCAWLIPLSWLYHWIARLRRRHARPERLPVPVIVVGNLVAGGAGKTPLVLWLVQRLRVHGFHPGVISRGYGAPGGAPREAQSDSHPEAVGDEPVLLARRSGVPVWVGRQRVATGRALLAAHPEVDVVIADDGLQHFALARDIEIVVVDGRRGFGNGRLLPAGPLREPLIRLAEVDAVVINGLEPVPGVPDSHFVMQLENPRFYNLARPDWVVTAEYFSGRRVNVVAAIGHPDRFFTALSGLGLAIQARAFPDHHVYRQADLPKGVTLMTEKDAVKCAGFARDDLWACAVDATLSEGLEHHLLTRLESLHG